MTLVVLVVLLLASVALVRSFTNATLVAGSIAIKRDLVNQSEAPMNNIYNAFNNAAGILKTDPERLVAQPTMNYSPCLLPSDPNGVPGIPKIIQDDTHLTDTTDLDGSHDAGCLSPISAGSANDYVDPVTGTKVRWVIDRLCVTTAAATASTCMVTQLGQSTSGSGFVKRPAGQTEPIYRVTLRVTSGNTRTYVQTTFS